MTRTIHAQPQQPYQRCSAHGGNLIVLAVRGLGAPCSEALGVLSPSPLVTHALHIISVVEPRKGSSTGPGVPSIYIVVLAATQVGRKPSSHHRKSGRTMVSPETSDGACLTHALHGKCPLGARCRDDHLENIWSPQIAQVCDFSSHSLPDQPILG